MSVILFFDFWAISSNLIFWFLSSMEVSKSVPNPSKPLRKSHFTLYIRVLKKTIKLVAAVKMVLFFDFWAASKYLIFEFISTLVVSKSVLNPSKSLRKSHFTFYTGVWKLNIFPQIKLLLLNELLMLQNIKKKEIVDLLKRLGFSLSLDCSCSKKCLKPLQTL